MKTGAKILAGMVSLAILMAVPTALAQPNKLIGVWKITEVKLPEIPDRDLDAITITNPQPSIIIFTEKHYSWIDVSGEESWPDLPKEVFDAQITYLMRSFTANTGTYEIDGSTITFHVIVAIDPKFMDSSGSHPMDYRSDGDVLFLNWQPAGLPVPIEYQLSRLE